MRWGRSVRPDTSTVSACAGHDVPRAPTAMTRSPSMTTTESGTGDAPVPSMSVAPIRTCMTDLPSGECDGGSAVSRQYSSAERTIGPVGIAGADARPGAALARTLPDPGAGGDVGVEPQPTQ